MTRPSDPLTDTDRLLVDGSNLLPALARRGGHVPQAALIGRLRAAIPPRVGVELVFDGAPEAGMRGQRIASGLIVRHAGRRSADELLLSLVDETGATAGASGVAGLLVVTDDRELRTALHGKRGADRRDGLAARPTGPADAGGAIGRQQARAGDPAPDDDEREPWKPGRGATVKRGNPRRRRPSSGSMRS